MYRLITLTLLFAFLGCKTHETQGPLSISIDLTQGQNTPLSTIAERVDRVELETTPNSLMGEVIHQIEISEGYYFIKHGTSGQETKLFKFDTKGRFIQQIGKKGKGPGEYNYLFDFAILDGIKILMVDHKRILTYNMDAIFEKDQTLAHTPDAFYHDEKTIHITAYVDEKHQTNLIYFCYDMDGNRIDSIFLKKDRLYTYSFATLSQREKRIYVDYHTPEKPDTLYMVDDHQLTPFAIVDLQGEGSTDMIVVDNYLIVNITILGKEIPFGSFKYEREQSQFLYNLNREKGFTAKGGFVDDLYHSGRAIIKPIPHSNMFFYTQEKEYSVDLKTEPNPTLYIGTFKN